MMTAVIQTNGCLPPQEFAPTKDTLVKNLVHISENLASREQEANLKNPSSLPNREAVDIFDCTMNSTDDTLDSSVQSSATMMNGRKRSEDIWVHTSEEDGAFANDEDTDANDTGGQVQKFSSISSGAKPLSNSNEEKEINCDLSDPSLIVTSEDAGLILPDVSEEDARASSDDNDSQDGGSNDDSNCREISTLVIASQKGSSGDACSTPDHPSECDRAQTSESRASRVSETSFTASKQPRRKSILKTIADVDIPCKTNRRAWKKLPPPDMEKIKMKRSKTLAMLIESQQTKGNEVCPPLTRPSSHQRVKLEGAVSHVQFGKVFIREFEQTIGDNPSVSYGTPISLDWDYMDNDPLDLDIYDSQKTKRTTRQMFVNHYQRKHLLIQVYGHSPAEVKTAKRATDKIKFQRSMSMMMQTTLRPLLYVEEMRESVVRKAKRRLSKGFKAEEASILASLLIEEEK